MSLYFSFSYSPECKFCDVDFPNKPGCLCATGQVDSVAEETVARCLVSYHTRNNLARVDTNGDLQDVTALLLFMVEHADAC